VLTVVDLGPLRLECDLEATRAAYADVAGGRADGCSCNGCRNWVALRPSLANGLGKPLERLGIPLDKDVEIAHVAREKSGLHSYVGWWHFVGRVLDGPNGYWALPEVDHVRLKVEERSDLAAPSFADRPVLQLGLHAELPWVLDEPEPE
jgi:hypothetical protein